MRYVGSPVFDDKTGDCTWCAVDDDGKKYLCRWVGTLDCEDGTIANPFDERPDAIEFIEEAR